MVQLVEVELVPIGQVNLWELVTVFIPLQGSMSYSPTGATSAALCAPSLHHSSSTRKRQINVYTCHFDDGTRLAARRFKRGIYRSVVIGRR
jgi:hypothetical protein